MGGGGLAGKGPVVWQHITEIDGANCIVSRLEFGSVQIESEVRLVSEFALQAKYSIDGAIAMAVLALGEDLSGGAIVGGQGSDTPAAERAGELEAELRIDDAAGEEELLGGGEDGCVLDEEGPAFGEDDFVALID